MNTSIQKNISICLAIIAVTVMLFTMAMPAYAATALNVATITGHSNSGLAVSYERTSGSGTSGSASVSGDTIVGTAKGYNYAIFSGVATLKLTITNGSSIAKTLKFTVTKGDTCNSLTVGGTAQIDSSKSYIYEDLAASASVEIILTTAKNNTENSFTISSIELYAEGLTVPVTYVASPTDAGGNSTGSYSAVGTTVNYTADITGLTVSPTSGWEFYCWKDTDGNILSYDSAGFPLPDAATSVYAYFVPSSAAIYSVGTANYHYWEDAVQAAVNGSTKKIILTKTGTLVNGLAKNKVGTYVAYDSAKNVTTYTLPDNIQLVIPYASGDTGNFTNKPPTSQEKDGYIDVSKLKPAYTLTVSSGALINCSGDINVNGRGYFDTDYNAISGSMENSYGRMILAGSGTQLMLNTTGNLFAYGYIIGSGQVEATSGSNVYEILQLRDYPGGDSITNWYGKFNSFPLCQYYVQNIEAPYMIHSGANSYASMMISYMSYLAKVQECIPYICADSGLFHLTSGYLVRKINAVYGSTTATDADRITYDIYGDITVGNIEMTIPAGLITIDLDSYSYILGINGNIAINMHSGTFSTGTEAQYKLMPGAEMYIGPDARFVMDCDFYLYDVSDWTGKYFLWALEDCRPLHYVATINKAPTRSAMVSAKLIIDGTLEIGPTGHLYVTDGSNANLDIRHSGPAIDKIITGTGTIVSSATYTANEDGSYGNLDEGRRYTWNTKTSEKDYEYFDTVYQMKSIPAVGLLAGISTSTTDVNDSFGTATYYGQSDGYWYSHIINTNIPDAITVTSGSGTNGTKLSPIDDREVENIVGLVADGGTFTFTLNSDYVVSVGGEELTPDANGTYTLSNVTTDTTITLHVHNPETKFEDINLETSTCTRVVYCACGTELSRETVSMVLLDAINASADAEIILMLYFTDLCGLLDGATATVTMTTNGETVACEDAKFEYVNGRYLISQPVASGEMTSPVTVTFTTGDGTVIPVYDYIEETCSDSVTKTVTDYAERVLAIGADKQKNIIKALVTYGGYSQINFNTNADNPAYSILGDAPPELGSVTIEQEVTPSGSVTGLTQDGQQAFLDSAIYLRVYFVLSDGSINDYTFNLKRPNGSTAALTPGYDSAKGKYFVDILNIPAAYLDNDYTVTVTRGTETLTVKTSVFAYLAKVLAEESGATEAKRNAAKAMYLYGAAATEFFGK